jgi:hypothetical protein
VYPHGRPEIGHQMMSESAASGAHRKMPGASAPTVPGLHTLARSAPEFRALRDRNHLKAEEVNEVDPAPPAEGPQEWLGRFSRRSGVDPCRRAPPMRAFVVQRWIRWRHDDCSCSVAAAR